MSDDFYDGNDDTKSYTLREKALLALVVVVILGIVFWGVNRALEAKKVYYEHIEPPVQTALSTPESSEVAIGSETAMVTKLAAYEVRAVVKSKKNYRDEMADIIPIDVALAWDGLNRKEIDAHIKYWQRGRWYYFQTDDASLVDLDTVAASSSNHHLFPATEAVGRELKKIRKNDYVDLKGYLVNVTYNNRTLKTSTTRSDQGAGACEVMMVTEVVKQ